MFTVFKWETENSITHKQQYAKSADQNENIKQMQSLKEVHTYITF